MGNSFLEGGEQNSGTSGIGPLKRGLEEAGLLRPAVAPQSQRSLDSALGQAHTLRQATRNQHRLPGQPEAPLPSVASLTPLKQKIREGSSSSSSRTQPSNLPAPTQERPRGRDHKTSQSSPQSLDHRQHLESQWPKPTGTATPGLFSSVVCAPQSPLAGSSDLSPLRKLWSEG